MPGIDFAKIAEGMGCMALRVTKSSELTSALQRGLMHQGTSVIEVMVDSAVTVLYARKTPT
jgi:benzoylformate decarboxylase